ncbi:MAG: protein adenylyltransferase SelO [Planctomycetia bacterium]
MSGPTGWNFDNSFARLPAVLFTPAEPARFRAPRVSILNHRLAESLGLSCGDPADPATAAVFAGQVLPAGAEPIAQAYAGHQYGHFTMLGDGRAILLGEQIAPSGKRFDIQLKGAGRTMFSRNGDGLAALGPMLREYIISEAMHALGIPTSRSLAVVTTGETVYRTTPLTGAVLTRVAASHIRVGTFEYAARRDPAALVALADHAIARHYPEIVAEGPEKYREFLAAVIDRQAALIARWQHVGFVHGVMNTDNMAISGETIDYGPCAFMDAYDPDTVFSSIDAHGRYAYGNQPVIAQWNLARFAETLLPLLDPDADTAIAIATDAIQGFSAAFERAWLSGMWAKLGLETEESGDGELIAELLAWMHAARADWTNTFRDLGSMLDPSTAERAANDWYRQPAFAAWQARWLERLGREGRPQETAAARMAAVNPWVIPRNHRVEEALAAATGEGSFGLDPADTDPLAATHRLLAVLSSPFQPDAAAAAYAEPPPPTTSCYRTFCGT